ncbi:MAG: hypothetical protein KDH09_03130 [Chrysiogenetes bacterium]|nr:hypothetical protein [Chrysiogenetes bacterium]
MKHRYLSVLIFVLLSACKNEAVAPTNENILRAFTPGIAAPIASDLVRADGDEWIVTVASPQSVRLFEFPVTNLNASRIAYQASAKAEGVFGAAYLEMWVRFPGKGEFFSKALDTPLQGNMDWSEYSAPFFLQKGQAPDRIRLQLTFADRGTVRLKNVRVEKTPR